MSIVRDGDGDVDRPSADPSAADLPSSRRETLKRMCAAATSASALAFLAPWGPPSSREAAAAVISIPDAKSYSSNARNLDRISSGDMSGGSSYDNDPSNPRTAKRRAMVGCKIPPAREEAAGGGKSGGNLSERDCNLRVMGGDVEFMLRALRELDCPTCPYGVRGG